MTRDTSEAPRLAIVVHNGITGDSRVVKTAIAASRAGWDVLLLGWARSKIRTQTTMGPISVVRAPLIRTFQDRRDAVDTGLDSGPAPAGLRRDCGGSRAGADTRGGRLASRLADL